MTNYYLKHSPMELSMTSRAGSVSFISAVADDATVYLQIKTNNMPCVILEWGIASDSQPLTAVATESPTLTNGTVEVPAFKLNRQDGTVATKFYSNPTGISGGTVIYSQFIAASKGTGGVVASGFPWVLKNNTSYIWAITNTGNQATNISGNLLFAENVYT